MRAFLLLICVPVFAQSLTVNQTLQITVEPTGDVVSASSATLLLGSAFSNYAGSSIISNRIRTSPTGLGTITLQFNSDFSGTNGPKIANSNLTFTCSNSNYGTACVGTKTPVLAGTITVVSFPSSACTSGGGSCSANSSNSITLNFSVPDTTTFKSGTYTVSGTLTISSL